MKRLLLLTSLIAAGTPVLANTNTNINLNNGDRNDVQVNNAGSEITNNYGNTTSSTSSTTSSTTNNSSTTNTSNTTHNNNQQITNGITDVSLNGHAAVPSTAIGTIHSVPTLNLYFQTDSAGQVGGLSIAIPLK